MNPATRSISIEDESSQSKALKILRQKLSLKLSSEHKTPPLYSLFERNDVLGFLSKEKGVEFLLDFRTEDFRNRLLSRLSHKDPLMGAIGKDTKSVFDMTMGFAQDASLLAASGRKVVACEEGLIIFFMVHQALESLERELPSLSTQGIKGEEFLSNICKLLSVDNSNSLSYLQQRRDFHFDVVYLDPMFSLSSKSRRKTKDIEFLKFLAVSENREALFEKACSHAKKRVVVKQALKESSHYSRKPSFQVEAKSHRFDVFLM